MWVKKNQSFSKNLDEFQIPPSIFSSLLCGRTWKSQPMSWRMFSTESLPNVSSASAAALLSSSTAYLCVCAMCMSISISIQCNFICIALNYFYRHRRVLELKKMDRKIEPTSPQKHAKCDSSPVGRNLEQMQTHWLTGWVKKKGGRREEYKEREKRTR